MILTKNPGRARLIREKLKHDLGNGRQFYGFLYNTARLLGCRSQDCDDIASEAWMSLHESAENYNRPMNPSIPLQDDRYFKAWSVVIAKNKVIDQYRARVRIKKKEILETDLKQTIELPGLEGFTSKNEAGLLELQEELLVRISELDDKHRDILLIVDNKREGYTEIAKRLNIPIGTVKSRINMARKKLRTALYRE